MSKILLIGDSAAYSIVHSFLRGAKPIFDEVMFYDVRGAINKYVRFGKMGIKINTFLDLEVWRRKGNRDLTVFIKKSNPDFVIVIGNAPVLFSTIVFMKSISKMQFFLFWPDTLTNLTSTIKEAADLYDGVLSYSSTAIPLFQKIGFTQNKWFPFAGDTEYLGNARFSNTFTYDVSFLGGWRPEREQVMSTIKKAFPKFQIFLSGPGWKKNTKDPALQKIIIDKTFIGQEFGDILQASRINLNIIDETNFPAANMRFFEIPAVGGLQLSSSCPEQELIFKDGEHVFYFKDEQQLIEKINLINEYAQLAEQIRQNANQLILREHTYKKRFQILKNEFNG
jgi:spore maturation protein CgeB